MMSLRERFARAIWAVRPDGGKMGRPFPFEDTDVDRRRYNTASLDNGKVAACDLCFEYADAVMKEMGVGKLEVARCPSCGKTISEAAKTCNVPHCKFPPGLRG